MTCEPALHTLSAREPEPVRTGERQVSRRLRIDAPAENLWAVLADPRRHVEIDGSSWVVGVRRAPDRVQAGDEFVMRMRLKGVPYVSRMHVTGLIPGRLVEWECQRFGHRWRWEFRPLHEGATAVTETFDYSWTRPRVATAFERLRLHVKNAEGIRVSLLRLARLAADGRL